MMIVGPDGRIFVSGPPMTQFGHDPEGVGIEVICPGVAAGPDRHTHPETFRLLLTFDEIAQLAAWAEGRTRTETLPKSDGGLL